MARRVRTFLAGWLGLELLHSKSSPKHVQDVIIETPHGPVTKQIRLAGRTIDLTFFAVTRALDIVINDIWSRHKKRLGLAGNKAKLEMLISKLADPLIFSSSCTLIMFAWLYTPDRLPRAYNNWIKSAAAVDMRLLQLLRQFRDGTLEYGTEKPDPNTLKEMCKDYKWPVEWSDYVKTIPVPCHVIHLKDGHNCEYHAIARLVRSFFWALKTYLPLNLILVARNPSIKTMKRAIKSAIRSSAFLGTFIALFFYGICLARSRIGPYILGTSTESRQKIEAGINIGGGCLLCGWSVLVENPSRRRELGLFVAPRAMATIMPRTYSLKNQWKETLAFSLSTAVVFTAVTEKPNRVRGLLGKILQVVLVK
ncbi:putative integral membrane protein [Golovinomyces cichoracearum]|uniref:Putative integral membrane protein n=1 Tax=Golovinomyces cichoracearum TaxID=62708 RepID=A0A420IT38_9PEZI|nr:putative integral membrane protein [Golovinomyces cichoracearum]